jgi:hypothetical protein
MRQIFDFSAMTVQQSGNEWTLTGKLNIEDSTSKTVNQAYVKLVISFDDKRDTVQVSITLNKADKFQWIPASGNKIRFTFKINGREDVRLVNTIRNGKVDTTFVFSTVQKDVVLQNEKMERLLIDVETNLTLAFPVKTNGFSVKILTNATQQPGDVFLDLEFFPQNFNKGILNYGPIMGSLQFFNLPGGAKPADDSSAATPRAQDDSSETQQASGAAQMSHWMML